MIEAVGERQLDQYFRRCSQMLKPNGRLVIQAIVMPEQRYAAYRRNVDFIQAYIFPGGFLPSITAMQQAVARTGNLRLTAMEDISAHYARTLEQWRCRFLDRLSDVRSLGFDERFIRMWEYYLCLLRKPRFASKPSELFRLPGINLPVKWCCPRDYTTVAVWKTDTCSRARLDAGCLGA